MVIDEVRGGGHSDADLQFSGVGRWKGIHTGVKSRIGDKAELYLLVSLALHSDLRGPNLIVL